MAGAVNLSILNWAVLTISFFNTISLLWLGLMVLLAGNRRSAGAWLTGSGLLLAALFFTSHTAILGRGLSNTSFGMDFWWWVSWTPAAAAPLAWYGSLLWYSGYQLNQPHRHHTWVVLILVLAASFLLLLIFANPLPSYQYVAGRILAFSPAVAGIPLIIVLYVAYSLLCYLLPLDLLRRIPPGPSLEARARQRARPYLVAASVALLLAGILLAWTALWALTTRPAPSLSSLETERTVLMFDLAVEALVALAITLLGRTIVGFEVFTGRPLPRNRFLRQWRSTVILAGGFGAAAAFSLAIRLPPIYSLMLATGLMTLFYALYSWRAFVEREEFMERLRPFVASQNMYSQLTAPPNPSESASAPLLFETLCRDVLEIRQAVLSPTGALATLAGPPLVYPAGTPVEPVDLAAWQFRFHSQIRCVPVEPAAFPKATASRESSASSEAADSSETALAAEWAVPLWSSRGLDGILFLGEKINRNPFTEEEIEIAQTAGARLLDLLAGTEMAQIAMDILRQRLSQARVIEGQGRRVLHDEVLPELHTALLHLSSRSRDDPEIQQAMAGLSSAHRQIADLMREMPLPIPHQLAQGGLAAALQRLLERDFAGVFQTVEWQMEPEAVAYARSLPLFVNEVIFFAARELLRNAAVHGRGENPAAALNLKIEFTLAEQLCLVIEDNGAGFHLETAGAKRMPLDSAPNGDLSGSGGSGSGLRIHSTMLAAVGARLEVLPLPGKGTRAVILVAKPAKKY